MPVAPIPNGAKKGDVAAVIRSMPDAPPNDIVVAAKEKGIVTTVAYVRWRRWADKRGKSAPKKPYPLDVPAMFGWPPPKISAGEDDDDAPVVPRDVPAMFGGPPPRISRDEDDDEEYTPRRRRATYATGVAKKEPSAVKAGRHREPSKAKGAAAATTEVAFSRALAAFVVDRGMARARAVVDDLEARLIAAAKG